jgi:glycosyltransferase involved in cell wall biosynthesis
MRTIQLAKRIIRDDWGGTETVIFETARRLVAKGHPSEVFCTIASADCLEEDLRGLHIRRFPSFYPFIGLMPGAREILDKKGGSPFSFAMMRALKQEPQLDLIHLHTGNRLGGIGRMVARQRRIPYVISLHGGAFDIPRAEMESMAAPTKGAFDYGKVLGMWVGARKVLADASAILCVGYPESVKAQEKMPEKNVVYLPNGADTRRFAEGDGPGFRRARGIPEDAYVVLTLARIDSQKNQLLPVRMLPELLKREPKTHVVLVGNVTNTAYHDKVVKTAEELGVGDHLTVIPGIASDSPDLASAYHAADLFLLPSVHEPFGIVVLEAWSAGLPVIASRIGGIPHFVEEGTDGLLFDPADETSFLEAFEGVAANPERSRSLSEMGRRKARDHYDWDVIADRLIGVYEDAIRENSLRQ